MNRRDDRPAVLMISPQFRPLVGGYERAAERLSGSLAQAGLRVTVLTERSDPAWPARERAEGYDVVRVWCGGSTLLRGPRSAVAFAAYLLGPGRAFDVWHVHQYGGHAAVAVALGLLTGTPVIIKTTSSGPLGIARRLSDRPAGRLLRGLHRRASACLAVSEETRAEAVGFGIPASRVHLIPNGLDGRRFRPASPAERAAARRELGLNCRRLFVYVGRLSPEKDPLGLIEAWGRVDPAAREGAQLAVLGEGPLLEQARAAAAPAGSVVFAGRRDDVELWYRAADACVISSRVDGLSNSMIEALASGLPVISTRVSGSSVLAESPQSGLIVPVGDAAALAKAMERLLRDDGLRRRLAGGARAVFESRFSLERVRDRLIALYEGLA